MQLNSYVNFSGSCAEAFQFYETHLGGKIQMMMRHSESPNPAPIPDGWKDAVLHARITIGGALLMGADIPSAEPMRSAYLSLHVDSDVEAERIWAALKEGGQVFMPLEQTFFASRFGQLRDRFGINWMILHERPRP